MPKSSMAMRTPSCAQLMQGGERRLVVLQQHRFGDLQLQPLRPAGREAASAREHDLDQMPALELHRREVDGDLDRRRASCAAAAQACRSAHSPIGTISPVSSASGMNSAGRHDAALGMVPAQQRLEAADLVALEVDDRLVVELELAVRQRLAQIELQLAARLHVARPSPARRSGRLPRPSPLARYRARSAFFSSWSRRRCRRRARWRCRCWCRPSTWWPSISKGCAMPR